MILHLGKVVAANLAILACVSARSQYYFEKYPCSENDCSRDYPFCRLVVPPGCTHGNRQMCTADPACFSDVESPIPHGCTQGLPIEDANQQVIMCTEDRECPMNTRCEDPPSISYAKGEKPTGPRGTCCWDATKEPPNWRP
ncbi:uncharacterized protein LOC121371124 [Gigantopelta aegis]|uniref:uncharacterized protein LOC121371124 n=1 Tax=Gigantopelta aegis TaxID=1735272 RepID=UPI001B88BF06|nr:uncharacterized protein LOC121371124 [Gigantopelta aegis]